MSALQQVVRAIVFGLLILPSVLIYISWYRVVRSPIADRRSRTLGLAVLTLVTCSQVLLMLGLVATNVIGPDYGSRRYATILINLVAMMAATVLAALIRRHVGRVLVASCAWVTCSWLYAAAVSSTV
jgi:hypothetical protein